MTAPFNSSLVIKALPPGTPALRPGPDGNGWWVTRNGRRHGVWAAFPAHEIGKLHRHPVTKTNYRPESEGGGEYRITSSDRRAVPFSTWERAALEAERFVGMPLRWVKPLGKHMDAVAVPEGTVVEGVKWSAAGTPCSVIVSGEMMTFHRCTNWNVGHYGPELGLCPRHAKLQANRDERNAAWNAKWDEERARAAADKELAEKIGAQFGIYVQPATNALAVHGEGLYGLLAALLAEVGHEVFQELVPIELRMDRKVAEHG